MRHIKSGLLGALLAGCFGAIAVVGCSASGETGDAAGPVADQTPTEGGGSTLPPSSGDGDETPGATDGGKKDAGKDSGKTDAAKDAGAPPPNPGDACPTLDKIVSRSCGKCGKQEAICQDVGGSLKWSDYGPCGNEIGQCTPGETQACGNCGTSTCSNSCNWGTCGGQPTNSCSPGSVRYTAAGCGATPGGYKNQTCDNACQWGNYSATCEVPTTPNKMTIQPTVGQVRSQQWTLSTETQNKPSSSCNGTLDTFGSPVRYLPVEVTNGTAQTAKISAYHSKSPTGKEVDTVIWVYDRSGLPMTDSERGTCVGAVEDSCDVTGSPCGGPALNLAGIKDVTIPPGGKILVYSAPYSSTTDIGDGTFILNLRTDTLQ